MTDHEHRRLALVAWRRAVKALRDVRALDPSLSFYVGGSTLHLMSGPSHTDDVNPRPLHGNVLESVSDLRISGGDW